MIVERFTGSGAEWDRFVRGCGGWTHFHLYGWKSVIERIFPHDCLYLAARDSAGSLAGVLPLVHVRSAIFGNYMVSMPFVNYGGPLGAAAAVVELVSHATRLAERSEADLLELRSREALPVDLPHSSRKITVVLDLPEGGPDAVWASLDAKVRSQVRRPQKEGVTVRFGVGEVEPFFDVFSRHMRDLGTPTQSRRLFTALADEFGDGLWLGTAYLADRPIAAGCGLQWGDEFEMTWAAALREHNRIAPNMLLYWRFIERCAERSIRRFNFGRCTPNGGTHRFKRQWGGRDEPLWWYQAARGRAATPSPDDARFRWGPKIWQRLPVPLATLLGPRIVQYIP